jgi:hypothetical protein
MDLLGESGGILNILKEPSIAFLQFFSGIVIVTRTRSDGG